MESIGVRTSANPKQSFVLCDEMGLADSFPSDAAAVVAVVVLRATELFCER